MCGGKFNFKYLYIKIKLFINMEKDKKQKKAMPTRIFLIFPSVQLFCYLKLYGDKLVEQCFLQWKNTLLQFCRNLANKTAFLFI